MVESCPAGRRQLSLACLGRSGPAASGGRRRPPGYEHRGKTQQYQGERNGAPPVFPKGSESIGALTPGRKDAKKQDSGAHDLANPTHVQRLFLRLAVPAQTPFRSEPVASK